MSKRTGVASWDETFMEGARVMAKRSKDPRTQVGAVIVDANNIRVGCGYNGFPRGVSDEEWSWDSPAKSEAVIHAELNAILNSNQANLDGCRIYVLFFTCNECAKAIIQVGIREVIYADLYKYDECESVIARRLYDSAGVTYRQVEDTGKAFNTVLRGNIHD